MSCHVISAFEAIPDRCHRLILEFPFCYAIACFSVFVNVIVLVIVVVTLVVVYQQAVLAQADIN